MLGVAHERRYLRIHRIDYLPRTERQTGVQGFLHALFAKLLMAYILRFGQAVGIEEEGVTVGEVHLLLHVCVAQRDADRKVRLYLHRVHFCFLAADDQRCVMPGVAVTQLASLEVEDTDKEGDEHILVVLLGEGVVHLDEYLVRLLHMRRDRTEERADGCHHQRSRHTFAADVADAEEEFVVTDVEVIEVAAYLLGGTYHAVDIQIRTVRKRREDLR